MTGILPDAINGGVIIRNAAGVATNPASVLNGFSPPATFTSDCQLTGLPSDCTARFSPAQVNAIVSEILAFASGLNPNGAWTCGDLNNQWTNFEAWANGTGAGSLGEIIAGTFVNCAGGAHAVGGSIPTCAEMTAAISAAELHVVSGALVGTDIVLTMNDASTVSISVPGLLSVSTDANNLLVNGTDGKPLAVASDLISTDASNALVAGTDGKLYAPAAGGGALTDGDKGDIVVSGGGATLTVDDNVVTNAKAADVPTATLKGRATALAGDPEDLTMAQVVGLLDAHFGGTSWRDAALTTAAITGTGVGSYWTAKDGAAQAKGVGFTGGITLQGDGTVLPAGNYECLGVTGFDGTFYYHQVIRIS